MKFCHFLRGSMFDNWDYLLTQIISTVGSITSATAYQEAQNQKGFTAEAQKEKTAHTREKKEDKPGLKTRITNFFRKYARTIIIIISAVVLIFAIAIIKEATTNPEPEKPAPPPSPCKTNAPITSWPIKRSAMDSWLDEIDGYVSHTGAFFMRDWDDYHPIKIKDQVYPHSIGICIPIESQNDYYARVNPDQLIHEEYIEYSLGYSYKTLQFDYAIDDITFPDASQGHPRCDFRIVVDSCSSSGYLFSDQEHLFDTDWLNYRCRCAVRSPEMDISQCDTIRITVMWRFYMRQNGPISFNLAIMNPLLRAARIKY